MDETRRHGDGETWGHGDTEMRNEKPCFPVARLRVSPSPRLRVFLFSSSLLQVLTPVVS